MRTILLLSLLAVGCASETGPARAPAPPAVPATTGDVPPAPQRTEEGTDSSGGGPESVDEPLAVGWHRTGVPRAQKAADIEACYRAASAQVDKDIRIDDDIAAARDQVNSYQTRFGDLNRRVDSHYYSRQRISRFEDCMQARGYSR